MARIATFLVSRELMADSLAMPEGTEILGVSIDIYTSQIRFLVSHEELPEVPEGSRATEIMPQIELDYENKPSTWIKFAWGLSKDK